MLWILGIIAIIVGIILVVVRPAYRGGGFGLIAVGVVLVIVHFLIAGDIAVPAALS